MVQVKPDFSDLDVLQGATAYVGFNAELEHKTNYYFCTGVADEVQWNLAVARIAASPRSAGKMVVESGAYAFAAACVLDGSLLSGINLVGENRFGVMVTPAATINAFEIQNTLSDFHLKSIGIDLSVGNSGHGIYGIGQNTGTWADDACIDNGEIEDIYFAPGGTAAKWAIYLNNPNHVTLRNIYGDTLTGAGGLRMQNSSTNFLFGDNILEGELLFTLNAASAIGFKFDGNATKSLINNSAPGRLFADCGGQAATIGFLLDYVETSKFEDVAYENVITGIDTNISSRNLFRSKHYCGTTGVTGSHFNTDAASYGNMFEHFRPAPSAINEVIVIDAVNNLLVWNTYQNFTLENDYDNVTNTITSAARIYDWQGGGAKGIEDIKLSRRADQVTITGAVNLVDVTHKLSTTPAIATGGYVLVTPMTSGIGDVYVSNIGATTFRINFANQPGGGTWTFNWRAGLSPFLAY